LDLQKIIYGEKVSENPKEVKDIMSKLHELFIKESNKLTDKETDFFKDFLDKSDMQF